MRRDLPVKDLELLSAYLDGELNPRQNKQLQARLAQEAELTHALDALRQTRQVLRAAPRLRTPRSFTLTPEMAGKRQTSQPWYGRLQLLSAVATVILVVIVAGEVFFSGRVLGSMAPQAVAMDTAPAAADVEQERAVEAPALAEAPAAAPLEEPAAEEAAPAEAPADAAAEPQAENMAVEEPTAAYGIGGGEVEDSAAPALQGTPAPPATKDSGAPPMGSDIGGGAASGGGGGAAPPVVPAPTMAAAGVDEGTVQEDAPADGADAAADSEDDLAAEMPDATAQPLAALEAEPPAPPPPVNWLRVFEAALLVVALLSGAAALWLRRQVR